jgi:hypothetical protein
LGLTLPQKEYERLAKMNGGILKQRKSTANADRPNIKRIKNQTGSNSARRSERNNVNYQKIMHDNLAPLGEEKMPLRNKSFTSGSVNMK